MRLVWLGAKILHACPLIWKTKLNVFLSLFLSTTEASGRRKSTMRMKKEELQACCELLSGHLEKAI